MHSCGKGANMIVPADWRVPSALELELQRNQIPAAVLAEPGTHPGSRENCACSGWGDGITEYGRLSFEAGTLFAISKSIIKFPILNFEQLLAESVGLSL